MDKPVLPDDLVAALEDLNARQAYDRLSPSHQREYLNWIEEAKRPETRQARIQKAVQMILEKSK